METSLSPAARNTISPIADLETRFFHLAKTTEAAINVGIVPAIQSNQDGSRTRKQYEVDFIATKGNEKLYIQSAYRIYDDEKLEQESNSLLKTGDSFRKIIVEGDLYVPYTDKNGIYHVGIIDFLLDEKSFG